MGNLSDAGHPLEQIIGLPAEGVQEQISSPNLGLLWKNPMKARIGLNWLLMANF